jgi:hypothetical protein
VHTVVPQGPKRRKLATKRDKETTAVIKNAKVEPKTALTRPKTKDSARRVLEEALVEAEKTLRAAQNQVKREHQARIKAKKDLAEAKQALAKVLQARVRRLSFVVRLAIGEQGRPPRIEIEDVQNGIKQHFLGLDGDRLVAFMTAFINPASISEHISPLASPPETVEAPTPKAITKSHKATSTPSGEVRRSTGNSVASQAPTLALGAKRRRGGKSAQQHPQEQQSEPIAPQVTVPVDRLGEHPAPTPRPPRPRASLIVPDVRVFRPKEPGFATLTLTPGEPFIVQARFQFLGQEARSLTIREPSYEMKVYANELTSGKFQLLTTYSAELVQNVLEYTAPAEVSGFPPGLYRLLTVVTLGPPIMIAGFHSKTIIHVI